MRIRLRLSRDEADYLMLQLDMWIEGYKDIDDEMPTDVIIELLQNREMAEGIRDRIWKRSKGRAGTSTV